MSRRNRTLIAASAAALAIVVVLVALHLHRSPAAADAPASAQSGGGPRVETATVRYGNVSYEVRGEGTISSAPGGISQASFTEAGRIAAVAVHIGEHVAAGQVLAQLDLAPLALQARQASGDLAAAEASTKGSPAPVTLALQAAQVRLQVAKRRLDRAERLAKSSGGNELSPEAAQVRQDQAKVAGDRSALQREQTLFKAGVAAQKDVEAAQHQLAIDEASLAADRAKLPDAMLQARQSYAQAESDLMAAKIAAGTAEATQQRATATLALARNAEANASLRAPISGVVTSLAMQPGEWASAGATIATIVNPAEVTLRVSLPADQTQRVQPGDAVQAGGITGHVWQVVHPLDPTTQMGQAIVTFDRTPSEPLGTVLPVAIRTGMHDHVLTVPATAVVQDPATGKYTIFVRDKNAGYTPVGVRVGWSSDGLQEVRAAGLRAGEKVATYGSYELLSSGG